MLQIVERPWAFLVSPTKRLLDASMISGNAVSAVAGPSPVLESMFDSGLPASGRPVLQTLSHDVATLALPRLLLSALKLMSGLQFTLAF